MTRDRVQALELEICLVAKPGVWVDDAACRGTVCRVAIGAGF